MWSRLNRVVAYPFWLDNAELARLESALCTELGEFLDFGEHALYFAPLQGTELLCEERRLLLPIAGRPAAVLRLDEVHPELIEPLLGLLPKLAAHCLEKVLRRMNRDAETGVESEEELIAEIERRIVAAQEGGAPGMGLITIDLPEAGLARRQSVMKILPRIAESLKQMAPRDSLVARLDRLSGNFTFAVLILASSPITCQRLAKRIIGGLENVHIVDPVSRIASSLHACAGHVLYPHDLSGPELKLTSFEQAILLRDRSKIAAQAAWNADHLAVPASAWSWIPMLCCTIQEIPAYGLARLGYGEKAGLHENQRYLVIPREEPWEAASAIAQIEIRKVRENDAFAEVTQIRASAREPKPGDGLILIKENMGDGCDLAGRKQFLARLGSSVTGNFALAITRQLIPREQKEGGRPATRRLFADFAHTLPDGAFAGRYGPSGLITCLDGGDEETALKMFTTLHQAAAGAGIELASGIFVYPCLNFDREESEACALKALAYAELLPAPHIGILDAFALAISADKLFSQGEETRALDEYRAALLLKPDDPQLHNSLGVCLAALNRNGDARRCFEQALMLSSDPGMIAKISYNQGTLYQKGKNFSAARNCFRRAVKMNPGHVFAWMRLAQTHEAAGKINSARALYRYASQLAKDAPDALNRIQRQLARLEKESNDTEKAREILHDSLVRNPADTASLLLLAQTYVNEDPAMAESLARKCLALGQSARRVLFEALTALGRSEEARLIRNG